MSDKEDYLTTYRVFFENFAATVNPEDQLPVNIAGYTITESELPGEVLYWTTQYLSEKQCPPALLTPLLRIILEEVRVASKKQPAEFGYKADESVYIALRLMQAVTARVNGVCLRYLDNSRLDSLPPPPPPHLQELKTVSAATKNSRRVMEDRHVEIGNLEALFGIESSKPTSFYAVYDGHAGSAAATYCAAHLHQYLVESPHFATDLRKALRDAFLRTDTEFIRKSNQERACGGSTAVAVAVRGCQLHAAWAGDSLALLAKRMRLMQLVRPHKPSRQDEKERIQAGGGAVMFWGTWRVNGQLAVSRAIGDAQYKPYVTARPELATVDLDGDEDFVVVACDGLWDFVSEDEVALAVYRQIAADPDDLKAVTKRLIVQAKRQGSCDNISIIVVFLKDPRDIAADNRPPMDLGLDNALVNASLPPFAEAAEARKHGMDAAAECAEPEGELVDNGVDNSDSDSEDLGPETAVDADDLDAEARNHVAAPTPPAHTVEASHIDGALADNVGESGEESEDEWNYFKGEGERSEQQRSEDHDDQDEPPRSETPCQDNSAWETSSVDMNSSPLNPDAPVFVPGTTAGPDIVLAESPRKPQPLDDIELPDVAQFETEAVRRPAELHDLDNCDQLNGHHNVSIDGATEQLNGNDKCTMDSLGFGFSVGVEPDKAKDISLIQDFERIQKDTTDFCNIQVFQAHTETNPFASDDNEELLERLKNKERDPMSMSFYQEKDDDSCERQDGPVDLNVVRPLPSDDELADDDDDAADDKENRTPEPNNDLITRVTEHVTHTDNFSQGNNFMEYTNNLQNFPNIDLETNRLPDTLAQTDTPESHKLLFEQIPEIPDGKSSELGFNEDNQDASDRAVTPQEAARDVQMECEPELESQAQNGTEHAPDYIETRSITEHVTENHEHSSEPAARSPTPAERATPEPAHEFQENIKAEIHNHDRVDENFDVASPEAEERVEPETLDLQEDVDLLSVDAAVKDSDQIASPLPSETPLSPVPHPEEFVAHETHDLLAAHKTHDLLSSHETHDLLAAHETHDLLSSHETHDLLAAPETHDLLSAHETHDLLATHETHDLLAAHETNHLLAAHETHDLLAAHETHDLLGAVESPAPSQSPMPAVSPLPSEPEFVAHLTPAESPHSPPPTEFPPSPLPADVPLPAEPVGSSETPEPLVQAATPVEPEITTEAPPPAEVEPSEVSILETGGESSTPESRLESPGPVEPELRPETASPIAAALSPEACDRLAADERVERTRTPEAASGPAPDLVPDQRPEHGELVTDIDIGIPESHAQEICVPVTSEIVDEAVQVAAGTPPPTPAVDVPAPPAPEASVAPLAAAGAAAAGVAVAAAAAASAAGTKARTPIKKTAASPAPRTTPAAAKSAAKPATTPASATKKPAAPRPSLPKSPAAAPAKPKPASTLTTKPSPRPAAKTSPAPAREAPAAVKSATTTRAAPAPRAAAPRAPITRPTPATGAATKPAAPKSAAARPATAPSTKPAPPRTTTAPRPAARPAPRPAPAPAPAAAKPRDPPAPARKPLTNGDAKPPAPIKRPPPITRPAPRPAPRPNTAPAAPAPATTAAATTKLGAPRPAARAPLDKQTKDLANRRITAKTAPPRTAPAKTAPASKNSAVKSVPKKPASAAAGPVPVPVPVPVKVTNGLTNGAGDAAPTKPPPSPPAPDNALLPDVIA